MMWLIPIFIRLYIYIYIYIFVSFNKGNKINQKEKREKKRKERKTDKRKILFNKRRQRDKLNSLPHRL